MDHGLYNASQTGRLPTATALIDREIPVPTEPWVKVPVLQVEVGRIDDQELMPKRLSPSTLRYSSQSHT